MKVDTTFLRLKWEVKEEIGNSPWFLEMCKYFNV